MGTNPQCEFVPIFQPQPPAFPGQAWATEAEPIPVQALRLLWATVADKARTAAMTSVIRIWRYEVVNVRCAFMVNAPLGNERLIELEDPQCICYTTCMFLNGRTFERVSAGLCG